MNPWAALALAGAVAGCIWLAFAKGEESGMAQCQAADARDTATRQIAADSAASAAAAAVAGVRSTQGNIRQEVQRALRDSPVYRDCRHPPEQLQRINDALTGANRAERSSDRGVRPSADAADLR